jgi:flavin-dependent dehydrogenase
MGSMTESDDKKVIVIGGGPAGLTAAFKLCEQGVESVVLEKDDVVGGPHQNRALHRIPLRYRWSSLFLPRCGLLKIRRLSGGLES